METLAEGFVKATIGNIPKITEDIIYNYLSTKSIIPIDRNGGNVEQLKTKRSPITQFDNVQINVNCDIIHIRSCCFFADQEEANQRFSVEVTLNTDTEEILSTDCDFCTNENKLLQICTHIKLFLFWLNKKSMESRPHNFTLWNLLKKSQNQKALPIKSVFMEDDLRSQVEIEAENITEEDGEHFLKAILDEMEKNGLQSSALYKHKRQVYEEFEAIFIHHTMLENASRYKSNIQAFNKNMEEAARNSLFERLSEASIDNYKKPLWFEVQFGRIRCSLMHNIAVRKDTIDDEIILKSIFCEERGWNVEERCLLKEHKRFILKQTEKLEDKVYRECGLLLHESYPYLCASPDGITDDHIVEIKAPKTDEEFEKYLEGKETISPKYMAQIQIQMYMANVTKALYCVLSPTFDTNGALHYVWVQADLEFVASLLNTAEDYWKDIIFPKLCNIYLSSK